jgi:NitT/TauT family transport system ATP-binding protein
VQSLVISDIRMEYERPRTHERVLALEDVSFEIPNGEFVSIVGPSGCGKSTLLLIIDGLVQATTGTVAIDGRVIRKPGRDRAMVFQEASLFPWFTTLRNCAYGLECQGVGRREAEKRARNLLEMVGLAGFEQHYPGELSVGMQQRANLARAIAVDPEVLLMDEPFAALDAQTRELMQAELLRIWAETRKTVVFITHQIDEAIYLSDRVIVMSARPGRIIDDINVNLARPRSLDVKRSPGFAALEQRIWGRLFVEVQRNDASEREIAPSGSEP